MQRRRAGSALHRLTFVIAIGLTAVLGGCSGSQGGCGVAGMFGDCSGARSAAAPAAHSYVYHLGPGDTLQITVYEQPDLTGRYIVDGQGEIAFPLIGRLNVTGKTAEEVRATLTDELNKGFLVNPKVTVQVANYRPYYILGEVNRPGSYPYVVNLTVREAIAVAGGYTKLARESPVEVTHGSNPSQQFDETPEDFVQPGDTIQVRRRIF